VNRINKNLFIVALCFFVGFVFEAQTKANNVVELENICRKENSFSYKGYKVEKHFDSEKEISTVTVRKGKRLIVRRSVEAILDITVCAGFYSLLGEKDEQLIIHQYTGGAHCCSIYSIYDLKPKVRLIFNGSKWNIGDGFDDLKFENLDKDKQLEFVQESLIFDYFNDMAYSGSPKPKIAFDYNSKAKKYLPSKKFASYLEKGVKKTIEMAKNHKDGFVWYWMLDAAISYIYAGEERKGWRLYDKELGDYPYIDGALRSEIKRTLRKDYTYRFLYRHKFRKRKLR